MKIYGDFHTHTKYSHGKGTVEDNVKVAQEKGLKAIAITDHGFRHIIYRLRHRKIGNLEKEIFNLKNKYNIEILTGVESNIIGLDGCIDLVPSEYEMFDVILAGFHKFVNAAKFSDWFKLFMRSYFDKEPSGSVLKRNTLAYTKAIQNNKIDVITHINYGLKVNCKEVAKAAFDYGTFIEINSKRITYTDEQFMEMYDTGVNFIINSDAHSPKRVGDFDLALNLVERLNLSPERIVNSEGFLNLNSERLPKFRSKS